MKKISRAGACLERSMIRLFLEEQERIAKTCDDMISFTVGEPDFIAPPQCGAGLHPRYRGGKD